MEFDEGRAGLSVTPTSPAIRMPPPVAFHSFEELMEIEGFRSKIQASLRMLSSLHRESSVTCRMGGNLLELARSNEDFCQKRAREVKALQEFAIGEEIAIAKVLGSAAETQFEGIMQATHQLRDVIERLDRFISSDKDFEQTSTTLQRQREKREKIRASLATAAGPEVEKRQRLEIKKLRQQLDMIDEEIEIGDRTMEDKMALEQELAEKSGGDRSRRRALRDVAILIVQGYPELQLEFPAAVSVERWAHLPRREFSDYQDVRSLFDHSGAAEEGGVPRAGFQGSSKHILLASIDDRQVVLKGYTAVSNKSQFEREIRALQALQHSNIITATGVTRNYSAESLIFYLELEYCDGGNITTWVEEAKPERSTIVRMLRGALRGLSHVHSIRAGPTAATHSDVKDGNILVSPIRYSVMSH